MRKVSKIWNRVFATVTISLSLSLINFANIPSYSQDLETLFSGQDIPLTLKFKDLNATWRKVSVSGQFEMGDLLKNWTVFMDSLLGTKSYNNIYYTQGKTIIIGNNTYMIAYRIPMETKPLSLDKFFSGNFSGKNCEEGNLPIKLTQNTEVSLALLNLNSAGSFNDLMIVDINREIAESEKNYQNQVMICQQALLDEINKEGRTSILSINTAQQNYYIENAKFINSWDDLPLELNQESEHYRYSIESNNNGSFSYAIPKNKELSSYVGAVFYDSELDMLYQIICKSKQATNEKLGKPTYKDTQISCPVKTIPVE
jgi:hypothetical protein